MHVLGDRDSRKRPNIRTLWCVAATIPARFVLQSARARTLGAVGRLGARWRPCAKRLPRSLIGRQRYGNRWNLTGSSRRTNGHVVVARDARAELGRRGRESASGEPRASCAGGLAPPTARAEAGRDAGPEAGGEGREGGRPSSAESSVASYASYASESEADASWCRRGGCSGRMPPNVIAIRDCQVELAASRIACCGWT
eukprot:674936-Prymnesium_polylepis.3